MASSGTDGKLAPRAEPGKWTDGTDVLRLHLKITNKYPQYLAGGGGRGVGSD